jgi:hypothetical protein
VTFSCHLHYPNYYRTYTNIPLHRLNLLLKAIPLFFRNDKNSNNNGRDAKHGAGNSLSYDVFYLNQKGLTFSGQL